MERRLAAILAVDVVGYSRLMEWDEAGTFARLRAHRKEFFEPEIAAHNGRVFKLMGDGLLAEFGSVVDAIECAVALQAGMDGRNAAVPTEHRIDARIGVNLGDVIVEREEAGAVDMHGEGVIIANRLQALAEVGGICVSQTVVNHVGHKVAVGFEFVGEQRVKNIAAPVQVYRVLTQPEAVGRTVGTRTLSWRRRRWPVAAAALAIVIAGTIAWQRPWEPKIDAASVDNLALPLPDKPSIAVLPFANMSDDPKQEYFVDGMTDDLITELSKVSGLFVISRNSTFVYKGRPVTPKQVSKELGVRYILEGSVQRAGERLRINAQLIDALTSGHVWADRYDGALVDVFAVQDRVTSSIADALAIRLTAADQQSLAQQETSVPAAYDAFLRGRDHLRRANREDNAKAVPYFEEAIRLDPDYGRAHAALALAYFNSYQREWNDSLGISGNEAYERASRILGEAEKHPTSTARQVAGALLLDRGAYDKAIAEFKEAIVLDPSDSSGYAYLALALSIAGQSVEALPRIEMAMRLDPRYPPIYLHYLGLAQFGMERFREAAVSLKSAANLNPDDPLSLLLLGAAYGHLGLKQEATSAIARYDAMKVREGGMPISIRSAPNFGFKNSVDGFRVVTGLRLAGVPESLFSSDFARKNKLMPDEVRTLFFGRQIHGHAGGAGIDYGAAFKADGSADLSGVWGLGTGLATEFEGDALCFEWPSGYRRCGTMYRNPGGMKAKENEYIWFDGYRVLTFSQVE